MDNSYITYLRDNIVSQYKDYPTDCGSSFGEILCWEIHENGLTFKWLAEKWGVSLALLGELVRDHCIRLEELPKVNHEN
ncbi:MAG TPA: hypothetical protein G4N92_04240 [Anaerolineae bacterium]|nr:hypothetical protein [Anaerolineae bacterium]